MRLNPLLPLTRGPRPETSPSPVPWLAEAPYALFTLAVLALAWLA
jgi:hypothetical protein